jgi:integrase/recombinase XerD
MREADGLSRRSRNFPLLVAYPTRSRANMPKNLKRRGNIWWFRKRIKGKDEEFSLQTIGTARLDNFVQRRREAGASNSTIRRDLACLSVIFSKAQVWEWVTNNPVGPFLRDRGKSGLKEGSPRKRYLLRDEEDEILPYAPPKAAKAMVFAIDTGLRKEEQLALEWSNVDFNKREILAEAGTTKNSRPRRVPIVERTFALLKQMFAARDLRCPYVFVTEAGQRYSSGSPTLYEALQKAVARANKARKVSGQSPMPHVEWHDLRRTCGCRLIQDRGFSMEEVAKWLGHSSVTVTERHYAFLADDQLHRAIRRSERQTEEPRQHSKSGQNSGHRGMRTARRR